MFLAGYFFASIGPMFGGVHTTGEKLGAAIGARFEESQADKYGLTLGDLQRIVRAVVDRYAAAEDEADQIVLVRGLHIVDLVLARACAAGNEAAWQQFLTRFRAPLYAAAYRIARNEATGRELADELYAELYGLPNKSGNRICRMDYYMGRGSFEGWLRTVLSQQYVNRYRSHAREVSLDEQLEAGVAFAASEPEQAAPADPLAATVSEEWEKLNAEERLVLASWYLDGRTLAEIGRQLGVHESTISRRLDRLTTTLRNRVRKRLLASGWSARQCDERMQSLDVRDLNVNVRETLKQESAVESFHK